MSKEITNQKCDTTTHLLKRQNQKILTTTNAGEDVE